MAINYVIGDATNPPVENKAWHVSCIVHICNDIGAWGAGFVVALSKKWKEPELEYRDWSKGKNKETPFVLGQFIAVPVQHNIYVVNLIGQSGCGWRNGKPPIRYDAVESGLTLLNKRAVGDNFSFHMPRIGCGLAGGEWKVMEKIIERTLDHRSVTVYDLPFC